MDAPLPWRRDGLPNYLGWRRALEALGPQVDRRTGSSAPLTGALPTANAIRANDFLRPYRDSSSPSNRGDKEPRRDDAQNVPNTRPEYDRRGWRVELEGVR